MKQRIFLLVTLFSLFCGCTDLNTPSVPPSSADSTLSVHFIDVGQADSALLSCDGDTMLIDGGNVDDSSLLVSYLEQQGVEQLDYVICTHAHEDHVGGLSGPLNVFPVSQVFSPVTSYNSKAFNDFLTYADLQGILPYTPDIDQTFSLGSAVVTILGPRQEYTDTNNTSIVLRVDFGQTSFLFTGDMERDAEADLLEDGCELNATVLKVGHHGSSTSTSYPFLREVMPQYAVISVGQDNAYGHPSDEVLSRLSDADCTVYRTDQCGTIVAVSDGISVRFSSEYSNSIPPSDTIQSDELHYIGNQTSQIFHRETCPNLPSVQNQIIFSSRQQAVDSGYRPCGNCKP